VEAVKTCHLPRNTSRNIAEEFIRILLQRVQGVQEGIVANAVVKLKK
jgi:hypothetical protein